MKNVEFTGFTNANTYRCKIVMKILYLCTQLAHVIAVRARQRVHSRGAGNWSQLMAGSGGSQGLPASAPAMASSAVMPWTAVVLR